MNTACEMCKGACCESMVLYPSDIFDEWLVARLTGSVPKGRQKVVAMQKCAALDACGKCSIYSDRPKVCKIFEVGCEACLSAIVRSRKPEEATQIIEVILKQVLQNEQTANNSKN